LVLAAAVVRGGLVGASALAAAVLLLTPEGAAAAVVTPDSATNCSGGLTIDASPTADDPNLLDYGFYCDGPITAYSLLVNRPGHPLDGIDDFDSSPSAQQPDGTPVSNVSVACSGTLPGDGINCNTGAGGQLGAWVQVDGTVDTSDPYCPPAATGAKTKVKPEAPPIVQLVVTDITGAQDGPFRLYTKPLRCKATAPAPKKARRVARARKHARRQA
jgi:hypothetical protein